MTRAYRNASIGTLYCLIIVGLIAAKFTGSIGAAWWLVLIPLWGPFAIVVVGALVAIICIGSASDNPFR